MKDIPLERLTDDQLRELMRAQCRAKNKALSDVAEYDRLMTETAAECLRRFGDRK